MQSNNRDAGLAQVVGTLPLAASMVNIVVGAGIFVVPAQLSAEMGALAPWAVLICAIGVGAIGICFAEAGSRVPSSGGIYAIIEAAFGHCAGYVCGTLFWLSNLMACAAVASALGDAVAAMVPHSAQSVAHIVAPVVVVYLVCAINIGGIGRGMRLVSATVLLKIVPLAMFLIVGVFAVKASNFVEPTVLSAPAVGQTLLLTLFAFQGFETSLCVSGEVRQPTRTIPRALLLALGTISLLYVSIQLVAQGVLGPALAHSSVPLADAMGSVSPVLRALMLAGAAFSLFGWMTSDLLGSPRILFAFARDGLLPPFLGRLGRRGQAPYMAIICYGTLAIALATTGDFARLAAPAALVMAALYVASAAAAWHLARRGVALGGTPLRFRWLGAAVVIGGGSMLAMIMLGSWSQIRGLLVLAGLSVFVYFIQTRIVRWATASRQAPA